MPIVTTLVFSFLCCRVVPMCFSWWTSMLQVGCPCSGVSGSKRLPSSGASAATNSTTASSKCSASGSARHGSTAGSLCRLHSWGWVLDCLSVAVERDRGANRVEKTGATTYQLGNTSSRTITEVKQHWTRLVLEWETVQVLPECCC